MFAFLLPALLALSADEPKGAPPQFAYVEAKDGKITRTVPVITPRVTYKEVIKEVGGKKLVEKVAVTENVTTMTKVVLATDKATFSTAGGKKLEKDAALKALATPQMALLSTDGKPVDAAYVKTVNSSTIIIVLPASAAVPAPLPGTGTTPAPLPPPKIRG
jgi:hypothetical protein